MSSTQQLLNLHKAYNLKLKIDLDIPFINKFKDNVYDLDIRNNQSLDTSEKLKGYRLNIIEGLYEKPEQLITYHKKADLFYKFLNKKISRTDAYFKLLSHPIALSLFQKGEYVLHASAIEINNEAYIFIGPSGSGKSTIVSKLLKYGNLITEDIARIELGNDKTYIFPSIPIIKLDESSEKSTITDIKEKFSIAGDVRKRKGFIVNNFDKTNKKVPIKICFVLQESNRNLIKHMSENEVFKNLFLNSFCALPKHACMKSEKQLLDNISNFLKKTKIMALENLHDHNIEHLIKFLKL
mgnify:CR=1 FL=1|tara:strand:+ start:3518 stop:4405 length:888 start_codon:yes stop_codon:yes gene_type:complete